MEPTLKDLLSYGWIIIVGLGLEIWRRLNGDIKAAKVKADAAVPSSEFKEYMDRTEALRREELERTEKTRQEFRSTAIDLFKEIKVHTEKDSDQFKELTEAITDQTRELRGAINEAHLEMLRKLPKRKDD